MRRRSQDCALTSLVLVAACAPVAPGEGVAPQRAEGAGWEPASSTGSPSTTASASAAATASASAAATASGPAAPDPVADWPTVLARAAITPGSIAKRSLWTWTTLEQGRALVSGSAPVLTREISPRYGPSAFDWMLSDVAPRDRLAALLFHEGFAKKRFAWSNTYAAALGGGAGRYGTVLMRVDLAPNALILDWPRRAVVTASGERAKLDDLFREPGRLAAVFWEGPGFREYVLVNESQIERVAVADAEVIKTFMEDRALVSAVLRAARQGQAAEAERIMLQLKPTLAFAGPATPAELEVFEAALVTLNIDGLDGVVTPKATFTLGARRATLEVDCKLQKTFDSSFSRTACEPRDRCEQDGQKKCVVSKRSGHGVD